MVAGVLRRVYTLAWTVALVLLVLLALYASLGRQYIGLVSRYQEPMLGELEALLGIELKASGLTGSWLGLSPVLRLDYLDIADGAIRLDSAEVVLNPIASVFDAGLRLTQLRVGTLELNLQQREDGRWQIPGIAGGGSANTDSLLDIILAVRRASLAALSLRLHFADGRQTEVRSQDFSWSSDGRFRRSYASFSADQRGEIRLIAEALGDPRDRAFQASAYIEMENSGLSALAPLFGNQQIIHNPVDGQLWLSWRAGRRMTAKGRVLAEVLEAGALWGSEETFNQVSMEFVGRHRNDFWQVGFSGFSAQWREQEIDLSGLSLARPRSGVWEFSLPALSLSASAALLSDSGVISQELKATLGTLRPQGQLKNLRLHIDGGQQPSFGLKAELAQVSLAPWQGAPGAEGVNGYLELNRDSGRVVVDSEQVQLAFPNLYAKPFVLSDLRGELRWQRHGDRLLVSSSPLTLMDEQSPLTALLRLDLPLLAEAPQPPTMTLSIGAQRLVLASALNYVPRILDQGLRDWLGQSVSAGLADRASFIYRGSLRDGDAGARTVQLALDVRDVELAFDKRWPAVFADSAQIYLDDGALWAQAKQGRFVDVLLPRLDVRIDDQQDPVLSVNTQASASAAQVKALFRKTPLGEMTANILEDWQLRGKVDSDFSLSLPLRDRANPDVVVESSLDLASLGMADLGLNLTRIRGPLHYSSAKGLVSPGLTAKLFGEPIRASIAQHGQAVHVDAKGFVEMASVQRWLNQPALGFLQGRTEVGVSIQAGGETPGFELTSSLLGVDIRLPQPLYKSAQESRALLIRQPFGAGNPPLSVELGERFRLHYRRAEAPAIAISLGDGEATPLREGALNIAGQLPFAAMDQWRVALDNYLAWASVDDGDEEGGGAQLAVYVDRLRLNEVEVLGRILHGANISARSDNKAWTLRIDSDEVAGNIALPAELGQPYVLMLERLALPSLAGKGNATGGLDDVDPRSLPALDVDIAELSIGERNYGRLGFDLRADNQGAHFLALRGQLLGIDLGDSNRKNALHWWQRKGGLRDSQLKGRFAVKDLGRVLTALGYERALETESGGFDVNLSWPGSPDQWSMSASQGRVKFALKNGRFLKTSDAASGALRVLGIFNMTNIVRRLKFDFRDVFSKGVHFDDMRGELGFGQQRLVLSEPLSVTGPSSRFQMNGNIDLVSEALDMRLVATLPVGSNLPWVVALVGGLPAAAGAYVVTKVFEEQVDSFSSAVYDIKGTVQQPELSFRTIFDASASDLRPNAGEGAATPAARGQK